MIWSNKSFTYFYFVILLRITDSIKDSRFAASNFLLIIWLQQYVLVDMWCKLWIMSIGVIQNVLLVTVTVP